MKFSFRLFFHVLSRTPAHASNRHIFLYRPATATHALQHQMLAKTLMPRACLSYAKLSHFHSSLSAGTFVLPAHCTDTNPADISAFPFTCWLCTRVSYCVSSRFFIAWWPSSLSHTPQSFPSTCHVVPCQEILAVPLCSLAVVLVLKQPVPT